MKRRSKLAKVKNLGVFGYLLHLFPVYCFALQVHCSIVWRWIPNLLLKGYKLYPIII